MTAATDLVETIVVYTPVAVAVSVPEADSGARTGEDPDFAVYRNSDGLLTHAVIDLEHAFATAGERFSEITGHEIVLAVAGNPTRALVLKEQIERSVLQSQAPPHAPADAVRLLVISSAWATEVIAPGADGGVLHENDGFQIFRSADGVLVYGVWRHAAAEQPFDYPMFERFNQAAGGCFL